jgi:hypothetical protein
MEKFRQDLNSIAKFACSIFISLALFLAIAIFLNIPRENSIGAPLTLDCDFLALSRRGWGCPKMGGFIRNPQLLGWFFLAISLAASARQISSTRAYPLIFISCMAASAVFFLAALIRIIYYIQGYVDFDYFLISFLLLSQGVLVALILICIEKSRLLTQHKN